MDHISVIVVIVLIVVAMVFIVVSGIGAPLVSAWRIVAATMKGCVHVPWGIFLIVIGVAIAWQFGDLIGCVIGGVFVYFGGGYLFGAIDDLNKASRPSKPDR
jgi:hypothetical protein